MEAYCDKNMNIQNEINKNLNADIVCYVILLKPYANNTYLKRNINGNKWMLNDISTQISFINVYGKCAMLNICFNCFNCSQIVCNYIFKQSEKA